MSEYYVIKTDTCPDCQGRASDTYGPNCIACNCTGKIQSVATLEEALAKSSIGIEFQTLLKNMNELVDRVMKEIRAGITGNLNKSKGGH